MNIHLGYEIGTGDAVEIPSAHIAVTGQTQQSGKTTTLEAMVSRASVKALAFVTKRGESSFAGGHRVAPYFRDRADWQFVTALLDATLQEKNKFLRPWIMKICRTTKTLADVHRAVHEALKTAKGINEGVYTQIDAYLELIVPEIQRTPLATRLSLDAGLNVMDVGDYSTPMQMLFVQSAIDWINEHSQDTVVIIPEAWEFIPEGKGSPVKNSAVSLVRKGAGIKNFIWVDSQDMAGVDKVILRGCTVWLIGVQREANEIKRSLSNIPKGMKRPKAEDIALLERGQFFACWGKHIIKTYVQPSWMNHKQAHAVAIGDADAGSFPSPKPIAPPVAAKSKTNPHTEENAMSESTDKKLDQLIQLMSRQQAAALPAASSPTPLSAPVLSTMPEHEERLYQAFKARLIQEAPALIKLTAESPEIEVGVTRKTIKIDGDSLSGRLALLLKETDWFDVQPRGQKSTYSELQRRGFSGFNNVQRELVRLAEMGFLTCETGGFKAVLGMKKRVLTF